MNQLSNLLRVSFEKHSELCFIKVKKSNDCVKIFKYGEFADLVSKVENNLKRIYVPDMKIIILDSNGYEYIAVMLAAINCGITYIPVDTSLSLNLLANIINDTRATHIYLGEDFVDKFSDFCNQEKISILSNGIFNDSDLVEKQLHKQEKAVILYTSGSTGNFKGVVLKYENLYHNVLSLSKGLNLRENTTFYNTLPFFHSFSVMTDLLYNIWMGNCLCLGEDILRNLAFDIEYFKPDYIFTVPLIARKVIEIPRINKNLKSVICGGAKVSEELISKYMNKNIELLIGYGITECSPAVSVMRSGTCYSERNCVGHILDCNEVRIFDGEILIKGKNVMEEYLNNKELSNSSFYEGYFKTGDMGFAKDGKLFINGRKKDVLSLENGKNIHPENIESFFDEKNIVFKSLLFLDGDNENKLSIILFIDSEHKYSEAKNIVDDYIKAFNSCAKFHEKIKKMYIIPSEFALMTSTNKLKRGVDLLYKDKANIYCFILETIEQMLSIEIAACSSELKFLEDLDMDSFDYVALVVEMENKFNISIKDADLYEVVSVKDLVELLYYKIKL